MRHTHRYLEKHRDRHMGRKKIMETDMLVQRDRHTNTQLQREAQR